MSITHPSMRKAKTTQISESKQELHIVEDATAAPLPQQIIPNNILNPTSAEPPVAKQTPPRSVKPTKFTGILEELLFLGKNVKDVKIENMTFGISTLTQKETSDLMKKIYESEDASDLFTIRVLTLGHAVKSVNGMPLEDVPIEGSPYDTDLEKKTDILSNMQKHVIEKLHDSYIELTTDSEKLLEDPEVIEELKNS